MINVSFDKLSKFHIDDLILNAVAEGKTLEFKQSLPGNRDEERKEFLADVSSFANASGGDIVFGVVENRDQSGKPTGVLESAKGLESVNLDAEILRLESMIRDGLQPRIIGIRIKSISGFENGDVVVVRVPQSWASPHMVTFKASPRFFTRTGAGKSPLDVHEIRAAFLASDSVPEKLRRFRDDRIAKILADEVPWPLQKTHRCVLHIIPYESVNDKQLIDPLGFGNGSLFINRPNGITGYDRLNLDGYVALCTGPSIDGLAYGYTQVFRSGQVEFVDSYYLRSSSEDREGVFPISDIEELVFSGIESAVRLFQKIDIKPPYVIYLAFLEVKGFQLAYSSDALRYGLPKTIDRRHLVLPDFLISEVDEDWNEQLRRFVVPIFDLVWQAFGMNRTPHIDSKRRWLSQK